MTEYKMTSQVLGKMTNGTLKRTKLFTLLKLNCLRHLTFPVVFNETLRASEASRAIEAGQVQAL